MEEQEVKTSKIEKLRKHIRENKKTYITGGVCLITGAIVALLATQNRGKMMFEIEGSEIDNVLGIQGDNNIVYLQKTISRHGLDVGRPGKAVMNLDTYEWWMSSKLAARDAGVSPSLMSSHLNGKHGPISGQNYMFMEELARQLDDEMA